MIFKVPEKFNGSCVLGTIKKTVWSGMTISINGNDLYSPDVKAAINKGILVPVKEEYGENMKKTKSTVTIVNKTDKVLVLGKITLRPSASLMINKDDMSSLPIVSASENGFIKIISDEKVTKIVKKTAIKKKSSKKAKVKVIKTAKKEENKVGEDREVTPVVWNFRSKEAEIAQKVPKAEDITIIDEKEDEVVEFIDEKKKTTKKKKKAKRKAKKKKAKKKTAKKKKAKKKKEISTKKKKVNIIEPVGEIKPEKTIIDASMELDSRGNPIGDRPSDILGHLIDSLDAPKDVGFVDDEQAQDRYNKRKS